MTTEYQVRLDRERCTGVFACLVRDDRFVEASDGLATVQADGKQRDDSSDDELRVRFTDERLEAAKQAARACPVDAIDVRMEVPDE
ncbi:MAG: ferredoxin [Halobacteriales archaeon]|nr:ferredoxin [Halobacteriales archaeon]